MYNKEVQFFFPKAFAISRKCMAIGVLLSNLPYVTFDIRNV